jgi:hypothetical protein
MAADFNPSQGVLGAVVVQWREGQGPYYLWVWSHPNAARMA